MQCRTKTGHACQGRCGKFLQGGSDWKVKSVEVFVMHNNQLIAKSNPIDMGAANMADFRSDLTDAQEEAMLDKVELIDFYDSDAYSASLADIWDDLTTGLSSVFPEVNRKPGQDSVIVKSIKACPDKTCSCDYDEHPGATRGEKYDKTIHFHRVVKALSGSLVYQITWTVNYQGYHSVFWGGDCRYYF